MNKVRRKLHAGLPAASPTGAGKISRRLVWIICFCLAAATFASFWPVFHSGFINLDDSVYVTANSHVLTGLNWENLKWAFTNLDAGFWQPLVWLSYMLDFQVFGLRPGAFHLTNVLLHMANTGLLFLVLHRLTRARWRSALVAALFALHPLHVESVAWISERKDVLSTLFWLLTMWAYVRYVETSKAQPSSLRSDAGKKAKIFYGLTLVFFLCGLMSKTMVVTLPLILLLLDFWPLKRVRTSGPGCSWRWLILEKLPLFAMALVAGLLTIYAEKNIGALNATSPILLPARLANAAQSGVKYLLQTFWPTDLAVFYPYPNSFATGALVASALALLVITAVTLWFGRRHPYLVVGWFWYVFTLLPVAGIIQVGSHARADRYTYVPLIGFFILLVWGTGELWARSRLPQAMAAMMAVLVIAACGWRARVQTLYWRDSETLFRHALAVTRDNALAYYQLGMALGSQGRIEEATENYQRAVEINPDYASAYNNLGDMLILQHRLPEATECYRKAINLQPRYAEAYNNLGHALSAQGQLDEAVASYRKAVEINPQLAEAYYNLGNALIAQHQIAAAIGNYRHAVGLTPNYAAAYNNLANALAEAGQTDEAIETYRRALEINPAFAQAHNNLANTLAGKGEMLDAINHYEAALRLNSNNPKTHYGLSRALGRLGRRDEAIRQAQEALRLNPDYAEAKELLRALTAPAALEMKANP